MTPQQEWLELMLLVRVVTAVSLFTVVVMLVVALA